METKSKYLGRYHSPPVPTIYKLIERWAWPGPLLVPIGSTCTVEDRTRLKEALLIQYAEFDDIVTYYELNCSSLFTLLTEIMDHYVHYHDSFYDNGCFTEPDDEYDLIVESSETSLHILQEIDEKGNSCIEMSRATLHLETIQDNALLIRDLL